jgi:NTP pyrophosphatase (non-canonical NTP hydrolase)
MLDSDTLYQIGVELRNAREKFPRNDNLLPALMEEVGELATAIIELRFAIERKDPPAPVQQRRDKIKREAYQVIAVAVRIIEEGVAEYPESQEVKSDY